MMPANYTALSENEMTYVVGGGLVDVLAPVMTAENWQQFSINMIEVVGNSFAQKFFKSTIDVIFGGSYTFGSVFSSIGNSLTETYNNNNGGFYGVLNAGLQVLGGLAVIYTYGRDEVGIEYTTSAGLDV